MTDSSVRGVYQTRAFFWVWQLPLLWLFYFGVMFTRSVATTGAFQAVFVILWWASLLATVWMVLWLTPVRIEVTSTDLRWRAVFRRRSIPLDRLTVRVGMNGAVSIKGDHAGTVWLWPHTATAMLLEHLRALRPDLNVPPPPRSWPFFGVFFRYTRTDAI